MEVGPTCHYVMGGVEVEPDTAAATRVPGPVRRRRGRRRHARLEPARRQLAVGPARLRPARRRRRGRRTSTAWAVSYPELDQAQLDAAAATALAPFDDGRRHAENPYTIHQELQQSMNDLVGIIRKSEEIEAALVKLGELKARAAKVGVEGHRQFNPGWHLALDLRNMLLVSEAVAKAALLRQESRGGHTRDDYPAMEPGLAREEPDLLGGGRRHRRRRRAADDPDAHRPDQPVRT